MFDKYVQRKDVFKPIVLLIMCALYLLMYGATVPADFSFLSLSPPSFAPHVVCSVWSNCLFDNTIYILEAVVVKNFQMKLLFSGILGMLVLTIEALSRHYLSTGQLNPGYRTVQVIGWIICIPVLIVILVLGINLGLAIVAIALIVAIPWAIIKVFIVDFIMGKKEERVPGPLSKLERTVERIREKNRLK